MSNEEVLEMMGILTSMTEEHFQECIEYVNKTKMSPRIKELLFLTLNTVKKKRQSVNA